MWNAGAVLTIGISALSPWMYIARNAPHLFSPCLYTLNIHEAMPMGSSSHVCFMHVSSPIGVKGLLQISGCVCSAHISGSHFTNFMAAVTIPEDSPAFSLA